ncbi:hypothetical protein Tco_1468205 [Tanacetum coccineum]
MSRVVRGQGRTFVEAGEGLGPPKVKHSVWLQSAEATREVFLETFSSYEVYTYGLLGHQAIWVADAFALILRLMYSYSIPKQLESGVDRVVLDSAGSRIWLFLKRGLYVIVII